MAFDVQAARCMKQDLAQVGELKPGVSVKKIY
jgi:hypothetical protein